MNTLKIRSSLRIVGDRESATRHHAGLCQSHHPIPFGLAPYTDGENNNGLILSEHLAVVSFIIQWQTEVQLMLRDDVVNDKPFVFAEWGSRGLIYCCYFCFWLGAVGARVGVAADSCRWSWLASIASL